MEHYFTNATNLKSEIKILKYEKDHKSFTFFSDNGVFAKDKIDYGSDLLVQTILAKTGKVDHILDVGCGYGFIGIVLSKFLGVPFTGVDINKRALHLCERNIKENKVNGIVLESNGYQNVRDKYDLIVTNPPIRAGKKIVLEFLENAGDYLEDDGYVWFVMRKDHGVKSIMKILEKKYTIEVIEKSKGFYVVKMKKILTKPDG